jgi:hypothetical protein
MKGGLKQDTMNPSELKRIIRCCYKSKVVSDKIINYLELSTFSKQSVETVMVKLTSKERYKLATQLSPYLSPIDDEDDE